jgi:hypothetical protein
MAKTTARKKAKKRVPRERARRWSEYGRELPVGDLTRVEPARSGGEVKKFQIVLDVRVDNASLAPDEHELRFEVEGTDVIDAVGKFQRGLQGAIESSNPSRVGRPAPR